MPIVLSNLKDVYDQLFAREAILDRFGRKQKTAVDEWERRSGVGAAIQEMVEIVREEDALQLFQTALLQSTGSWFFR